MSRKRIDSSKGFTIIELMIATVVFSVILLGATTALIQIGRMYYKGVIASRTQQTARQLIDTFSRPLQFNGQNVVSNGNYIDVGGIQTTVVCYGNQRFTIGLNAQVNDEAEGYNADGTHRARHAIWQDTISNSSAYCEPVNLTKATPQPDNKNDGFDVQRQGTNGKELLAQHMRIKNFSIKQHANVWSIDLGVIYGDDDLLSFKADGTPDRCQSSIAAGGQWCALAELSTQVISRIQ